MSKEIVFFIIILVLCSSVISGIQLKLIGSVELSEKNTLIEGAAHFCVTEDETFFLCDAKAADIKIFAAGGNFLRSWGRKGAGPREFFLPLIINNQGNNFAVLDILKKKVFTFTRKGKDDLDLKDEIPVLAGAYCTALNGSRLLIAGYCIAPGGKEYELYYRDLISNKNVYLLPVEQKYGFDSLKEYKKAYHDQGDIVTIGIGAYCDWYGDNVYYVWEGNLRIIKINIKTGKKAVFGQKSPYYFRPEPSKVMKQAYRERNTKILDKKRERLCYIYGIFAGRDYVGLIYVTAKQKPEDTQKIKMQFYTPGGNFINEITPVGKNTLTTNFYLKKDEDIIYFIDMKTDEEKMSEVYSLLKFKIIH
jgi:hypothetical protein